MKTVILCAGLGLRMGKYLKCLLEIQDQPLINRLIEQHQRYSSSPPIIVVGYKADIIVNHLKGQDIEIVYNPLYKRSVLISLCMTEKYFSSPTVFHLTYGDSILSENIWEMAMRNKSDNSIFSIPWHPFQHSGELHWHTDCFKVARENYTSTSTLTRIFLVMAAYYGHDILKEVDNQGYYYNINTWEAYEYVKTL